MEQLLAEAMPFLGSILGTSPQTERPSASPAAASELRLSVIDTLAGMEAIADEWRALEQAPGSPATPFQTYAFHREWVRHFSDGNTAFRIMTVRSHGRLVLILPLAVRRALIGRVAGWMGDPLLQYGDVICEPDADPADWLDAAISALGKQGDIGALILRNVRADAAAAPWLDGHLTRVGPAETAIAIDLSQFSEPGDFARSRTKGGVRTRKRRNRLATIGEVQFRILQGGEDAVARVAPAIRMKEAWLDSRGLMGRAFADPRFQACLAGLVREGQASGTVVSSLDVAGKPAAIEIGFRHNGRHCAFLGAFDPDLARLSPGQVQMHDTIEWNIAKGARAYDLMAPADAYKRELGTLETEVRDYAAVLAITGVPAAIWSTYGARGMKAAFGRLPRRLRSTIRSRLG